jgi:hypothetical protein
MRAQIALDSGERMSLTGFSAVDRARLKTLSANVLADLAKSDELELVYAHLSSMRNFAGMKERLTGSMGANPQPVAEASGTTGPARGNGKGDRSEAASEDCIQESLACAFSGACMRYGIARGELFAPSRFAGSD